MRFDAAEMDLAAASTLEPALQSAWIQRLKRGSSRKEHGDEGLQIPLGKLELGGENGLEIGGLETSRDQVQAMSKELLIRINSKVGLDENGKDFNPGAKLCAIQRSPRGFGSFRVKLSGVKFRKPPLPPAPKAGKADAVEAHKRKERIARIHGVDVTLEQQHRNGTDGKRRDLLAEFALRLDIKEKPTPLGTFHIVDRKKNPSLRKDRRLATLVSPISVAAAVTEDHDAVGSITASLTSEVLKLEASRHSAVGARTDPSSMEGNLSESRTLSTTYCGSSPYPCPAPSWTCSRGSEQPERRDTIEQEAEACFATEKRRREASVALSKEMVPSTVVKRSRISVGEATLAGPWLNRWRESGESKPGKVQSVTQALGKKQTLLHGSEPPSAAAFAIVGAAVRQLQSYSLGQSTT
ncbi:hypothetical protein SELMODRAFT_420542 [Selaginella moellendorffii]|uniref:Uncharacterized protein n=1 Tax=Selaginella moellendorffii TaxID=88036 RepID=D8SCC0_SELML|nr:uncharacterized protein LOC9658327 [Selaginella moellendorffii]EFJ17678.1 hypothetical protein SELMODRAFT_420542 [Selaginella moellendorffii]|eukprot:XP_002980977.1 uncharacterized protein LOC9658327 [Selaginella moellendorffii]